MTVLKWKKKPPHPLPCPEALVKEPIAKDVPDIAHMASGKIKASNKSDDESLLGSQDDDEDEDTTSQNTSELVDDASSTEPDDK